MKYGFIGAGNMAASFIKGMLNDKPPLSRVILSKDIHITDKNPEKTAELSRTLGITAHTSPDEIIEQCGVIFLAVKPGDLRQLLTPLALLISRHKPHLISFAAGVALSEIESIFDFGIRLTRIMPNLNAEFSQSITAHCSNALTTEADRQILLQCLAAVGSQIELDESLFPIFTAIAGCAPAFVYLFADALSTAAVRHGMDKATALQISAQTLLGSAAALSHSDTHPRALIDKVCSPGGATIDGICSLIDSNFESSVVSAVSAAYNKTKTLRH